MGAVGHDTVASPTIYMELSNNGQKGYIVAMTLETPLLVAIETAIAKFVGIHGSFSQRAITLPKSDYDSLYAEAASTEPGRQFVANGFKLWQLDVLCGGNEIVIS